MFHDIMSEKLAKTLKVKIKPMTKSVGTASTKGSVTILGKARPFKIYLENISEPMTIAPYVVRDLAHPMNLSQEFLRRHEAEMNFRPEGSYLKVHGSVTKLTSHGSLLTRRSIDTRIQQVLSKFKEQGCNPGPPLEDILDLRVNVLGEVGGVQEIPGVYYAEGKQVIHEANKPHLVYNAEKIVLKPNSITVVPLRMAEADLPSREKNSVSFQPNVNCKFMNNKMLMSHAGVYLRENKRICVLVTNFSNNEVVLQENLKVGRIVEALCHESVNVLDHRSNKELTDKELVERRTYIIEQLKLDENIMLNQDKALKEAVVQLFIEHFDAVAIKEGDYGKTSLMKFHINIPKGTPPTRARVRPLNPFQEKDFLRQKEEWESAGVIEPSISPWGSALVPVKKKGSESLRWAVDYRSVNKLTIKDAFPLSNIEGNLHKLSGSKVFSALDSSGAFHTIAIAEDSRDYTSFVSPVGTFRFTRLPFGLANAPSAYSRLVQMALDRLGNPVYCLGYIDDIIIHSSNNEEHLEHLSQVVALHAQVGMKLNLKKCQVFEDQVVYLGHLVSAGGIAMVPSYVDKVLEWPLPATGKDLRSFLGFCGYYRSFIPEFAHLTAEMNKLKNEVTINWPQTGIEKFNKLKSLFKDSPVRGYPDYTNPEPFVLDTDFSATNMAAVLSQKQGGKEVFLGCVARKCNKAQSSYPSHKGELNAVIIGLQKFEHILRARKFIIRTDSRCVQFLHGIKEQRGMFARWMSYLSSFNYDLVHRSGTKQCNADALSRMPGLPEETEDEPIESGDPLGEIEDVYALQAEVTLDMISQETKQDIVLSKILKFVKEQAKPNKEQRKTLSAEGLDYVNVFEMLSTDKDVLYYTAPQVNNITAEARICLPLSLQDTAFKAAHTHPVSAHYGTNNTFRKMRERFYFPKMYQYISAMVLNCVPCVTKKSTMGKSNHTQHREQLSYVNQKLYIDTVGPMTGIVYRGQTCKHILTMQDGFSRYLCAIPVPTVDANTLAKGLVESWIYVHGVPEVIHSDNGSAFTSHMFQEVMKQLGIVKTFTPAYSPEGNRVERAHRVLGDILRSDRRFEAKAWPEKLPVAVFAYNTTVNRVIGLTPFEAMYGRPAVLPIDFIFPLKKKEATSWNNYVETLKLRFQQIYEQVCQTQQTSIMLDQPRYQKRNKIDLEVGNLVYFFLGRITRGLSKKLQSRWIGPWKIVRIVSESLIVIYPQGTWCKHPREISTIVSRVRKVDPNQWRSVLNPSSRYQIDLEVVLDDLTELSETLGYQDDFESEAEDVSVPYSRMFVPSSTAEAALEVEEELEAEGNDWPSETPVKGEPLHMEDTDSFQMEIPSAPPMEEEEDRESDVNTSAAEAGSSIRGQNRVRFNLEDSEENMTVSYNPRDSSEKVQDEFYEGESEEENRPVEARGQPRLRRNAFKIAAGKIKDQARKKKKK